MLINLYIDDNGNDVNSIALTNLFELYLLYGITNTLAPYFAKVYKFYVNNL